MRMKARVKMGAWGNRMRLNALEPQRGIVITGMERQSEAADELSFAFEPQEQRRDALVTGEVCYRFL
jgi:hypothetical protein